MFAKCGRAAVLTVATLLSTSFQGLAADLGVRAPVVSTAEQKTPISHFISLSPRQQSEVLSSYAQYRASQIQDRAWSEKVRSYFAPSGPDGASIGAVMVGAQVIGILKNPQVKADRSLLDKIAVQTIAKRVIDTELPRMEAELAQGRK